MNPFSRQTLADIVTADHRTASVLEKYQLDFCCKGKRALEEACAEKGLSPQQVSEELIAATSAAPSPHLPFNEMSAGQLISHIQVHHHFYVKQSMPQLCQHLEKVSMKHGSRFPYMNQVFTLFQMLRTEMTQHLQKEETVLFPAIREIERQCTTGATQLRPASMISRAMEVMESEHDEAGTIMENIRVLTTGYTEPEGACNTFRLSLAELKAFENDLHQHVHLENNILFPMARNYVNQN
ncbi:MAG: iron-sulfur cluster repair di-iron protein [Chitinophagaceae bacterium]